MKKITSLIFLIFLAAFLSSCAESTQEQKDTQADPVVKTEVPTGDTVLEMTNNQVKDFSIDGFPGNSARLKKNEDLENMKRIIGIVKPLIEKLPDGYAMEIRGHAANYPTRAMQRSVSRKRAYKIYSELRKAGVPKSKMKYKGLDIKEPLSEYDGKDAKQRRVSFRAIKK